MKRWIPYIVVGVVVALVIAAVALAWTSDGPKAFRVRGQSVSQQTVNDQLQALAENKTLASAIKAQGGCGPLRLPRVGHDDQRRRLGRAPASRRRSRRRPSSARV